MKITITPSGDVTLDFDSFTGNVDVAAQLVNQLRNGNDAVVESAAEFQARKAIWEAEHPVAAPKKKRTRRKKDLSLTPALAETYQELIGVQSPDGISPADLAGAFGIKTPAMSARLRQLEKRGLAERVSRGQWRAVGNG